MPPRTGWEGSVALLPGLAKPDQIDKRQGGWTLTHSDWGAWFVGKYQLEGAPADQAAVNKRAREEPFATFEAARPSIRTIPNASTLSAL